VVIVDEVDNMLLDQAGNPAILSQKFKIAEYEGIFRLIYQLQDRSTLELQKIIKCTWAKYPVLDVAVIDFLKKAAHAARWHQRDRDYIVIDKCGKPEVVIMDSTTGSAKYGSRWSDFVHEMVEIKEGLAIREPGVSYFAITQNDFFNLYRTIAGVTGTLGDGTDALLLRTTYRVKIFSVPTNKPCLRVVSHVNGQPTPKKLKREILEQVQKNRPVLVIFEDIKTLKEFNRSIDCRQVIQGVSPKADELAVRCAGLFRMVTFATNAAGRGMDIKPTRGVLSAGGLHVII
jgi:preprotein translocase subunit SecA